MDIRWLGFGAIEIDGRRYERDVVIDGGRIRKRDKGPSKPYRGAFGHTPLAVAEAIPWEGKRLIVGTGADGQLPVMDEVSQEAERRGIEVRCLPTEEACAVLRKVRKAEAFAILHVTC